MSSNVFIKSGRVTDILPETTTTATGNWYFKDAPKSAIQTTVIGTGAVSATVIFDVSNDGVNAVGTPLGTIVLSGTTSDSDGFVTDSPWKYVRARVTAISGTEATVTVTQSV